MSAGLNPGWLAMLIAFQREEIARAERRTQVAVSRAHMSQRTADFIVDRMRGVLRVLEAQHRQLCAAANDAAAADIEAFGRAAGART